VLGSCLAYFVFDSPFPGQATIPRLFTVHVLEAVHTHTQYPGPGPGKTNDNVVGYPMMPFYMAKAGGFFFIVFDILTLMATLVTINPIWLYGPYSPSQITAAPSQTGTSASPTVHCN